MEDQSNKADGGNVALRIIAGYKSEKSVENVFKEMKNFTVYSL